MKREARIHDSKDDSHFQSEDLDGAEIGYSGPPNANKKLPSVRFEDGNIYEIKLDIHDESQSQTAALAPHTERRLRSLGSHLSSMLKQVSFNLKRLASTKSLSKDNRAGTERALKGLQFVTQGVSKKGWPGVEAKFDELAKDGVLPRSKFGQCIGMTGSDEFASHLFDALARRRGIMSPSVTKNQFHELWELLADKSFDARLQTFFDIITEEEVKEIITLSASANKLWKIRDRADEYTALIMEELDPDNIGYIEINSLEVLLLDAPSQSARYGANNRKMNQLLSLKLIKTKEPNPIKRWNKWANNYIEDHWQQIWVVALWVLINVGLFTWKFIQFKHKTVFKVLRYCVSSAKGGAEICKFNMALILLTVCRNTITWLRSKTKLGVVLPFDDNINFHMLVAVGIVIGIGLHAGAHAACNIPRILHATDQEYKYIEKFFGEKRPPNYWWFLMEFEGWTGATMIVLLIIIFTFALPVFRRNKLKLPKPLKKITGYNSFWYTHHLLVIVYGFYIGHSYQLYLTDLWYEKTAWMYLAVPILLYTFERLTQVFRSNYKRVKILMATVYPAPGDAIELHISKPHGFKYRSGQYIFLKCISISRFQWHPFSITSAPTDEHLSVHIRTLGDWTTELKARFSKAIQPAYAAQSENLRADMIQGDVIPVLPEICLDGPYGAPSQDYKQYDVLLLVGLGIGATPLVSIVKDVLYSIKQNKDATEVGLESGITSRTSMKACATTSKAYFYWVTREEGSFEWFKDVMNEVAGIDETKVIELHNHCTSVYEEGDARSALIAMLQTLHHAKTGVDIISGTNVKTHFARPNWRNVFKQITINHPNQRVGVFYCGDPVLVRILKQFSLDFSRKTSTKFDFHKENF